jgi:DNA polymerase I-like protein with 3'-5' exonuclease and polymerase domains
MYCTYHLFWKDEGKEWKLLKGDPHSEDRSWIYNCKDAVITYEIDEVEQANVKTLGLERPHAFQQALFYPVLTTMNQGVRIDTTKRAEFHTSLSAQIAAKETWLCDLLGYPLNPRSPKQMQDLFYKQLGQRAVIKRKTGNATCDEEALLALAKREPLLTPLVETINSHRSLGVLLSTFIEAPLDTDGRMRCYYNITGTTEYRFNSGENAFGSGTNLQNVPQELRSIFIPDEGNEFFDLDLSSADLRVVVWEADEQEMKALLAAGLNPYVEIAKEYYHDTGITKAHPKYRIFKAFAHGTHYLGTPEGMAGALGMSVIEVERLQRWYFSRFPRIRQWQEQFKAKVLSRRMVENIFGYRYYIFDRIDGRAINQAIAWLPASTIAILINHIWRNLYDNFPWIRVLLQVHDSLAGQYPIERRAEAQAAILSSSNIILPYPSSLVIPVGIKTSTKSWGDCK